MIFGMEPGVVFVWLVVLVAGGILLYNAWRSNP